MIIRIGHGFDVHKFGGDGPVTIGGVIIPFEHGLIAHSDGDVALHALTDAILGAAALGDIGKLYPDNDDRFLNIDSRVLLRDAYERVRSMGYSVGNVDVTIIAQAPKMRPYIDKMRENIASVLSIDVSQINIKATTEEGLGFTGSGEGIAAQAICMLTSPREFATMDMSNVDLSSINTKTEVTIEEGTCDPAACGNCPLGDGCVKRS